jgi:hypothetical protein
MMSSKCMLATSPQRRRLSWVVEKPADVTLIKWFCSLTGTTALGDGSPIKAITAAAFVSCIVGSTSAFAGIVVNSPIDVIGNLSSADFTGNGYGTNTYKDWGNEPSIAVNPTNPNQILVSSFAYGSSSTSGADVFYSSNGGTSFSSQFTITQPSNSVGIPNDWRFAYDAGGTLYGAVLGGCNSGCNTYVGSSTNPNGSGWTWANGGNPINGINNPASLGQADQPWIAVSGSGATAHVYAAYDTFTTSGTGVRVAASANGASTFPTDRQINNGPSPTNTVNPGNRIATDGAGSLYAIYGYGTGTSPQGVHTVTYYLNRSRDGGNTWDFNGASVPGGIQIASGQSTQLNNAGTQASNAWFAGVNDLRGNIDAIAADATGAHVYVVYGLQDGSGTDRVYLQEFHSSGSNLVPSAAVVMSPAGERAALPSVTVLADGTVVIEYETYNASTGKVEVHVAFSSNHGATIDSDVIEYAFTPLSLAAATGSTNSNREFGDYLFLTSLGDNFYGTFAGLGDVNGGGINTTGLIDPFMFSGSSSSVVAAPEPASLALLVPGLAGAGLARRRSRKAAIGATVWSDPTERGTSQPGVPQRPSESWGGRRLGDTGVVPSARRQHGLARLCCKR